MVFIYFGYIGVGDVVNKTEVGDKNVGDNVTNIKLTASFQPIKM